MLFFFLLFSSLSLDIYLVPPSCKESFTKTIVNFFYILIKKFWYRCRLVFNDIDWGWHWVFSSSWSIFKYSLLFIFSSTYALTIEEKWKAKQKANSVIYPSLQLKQYCIKGSFKNSFEGKSCKRKSMIFPNLRKFLWGQV